MSSIKLDGTDYTSCTSGLDRLVVRYEWIEGKIRGYATTTTVVFEGDAFDYLESKYFAADDTIPGCDGEVEVSIISDCCEDKEFLFKIENEGITRYCPAERTIEATLSTSATEEDGYRCLKDKIYWQDGFVDAFSLRPRICYCNDYNFLQLVVAILWVFSIAPILVFVRFTCRVLKILDDILGIVPSGLDNACRDFDQLDDLVIGCGRYHPVPYVKDIFDWNCEHCNLEFESQSIFETDTFRRTVFFQAENEEGATFFQRRDWIEENAANLTPIQMAKLLQQVFNAECRLRDGKFIFEEGTYFRGNLPIEIDVEQLYAEGESEDPPCYTHILDRRAYARFEYEKDALDEAGNKARYLYNDIVEWNDPPRACQTGELDGRNTFSAARFMDDCTRPDQGIGPAIMDWLRKTVGSTSHRNVLLLKSGVSSFFKLLIVDPRDAELQGGFPIKCQKILRQETKKCPHLNNNDGQRWDYNWPLWFDEDYPDQELYQRFWYKRNPRGDFEPDYELMPFQFRLDCELLDTVHSNGLDFAVATSLGTGYFSEEGSVEVNFGDRTMTLSGVEIYP